jgi:hypothetical protein
MYIYRGPGTDGFYDYFDTKFIEIIKSTIAGKYSMEHYIWGNEEDFLSPYEPIVLNEKQEIYIEDLLPDLQQIEFNGSYSFYDFVDCAGFLTKAE